MIMVGRPMIGPMWPTGPISEWRATVGSSTSPGGPAITTLRSVIAYLATMIRCAGIVYILAQVALWHSFYAGHAWRTLAPALAVAWAAMVAVYLRRHLPSARFACVDSAFYLALALGAQACVPPAVRDSAFSWLVIALSGQLIVPAWGAPGVLSVPLVLASPLAYLVGARFQPVTDARMMTGAAVLLLVVGLMHGWGRRTLYRRAASADTDVDLADRAAREQYALLRGNIARREHERLVHDTVLNTLTAVARGAGDAAAGVATAEVVTRCRQDVSLIEAALGGADDRAPREATAETASGDLLSQLRSVAADMRARRLAVHLDGDEASAAAIPSGVVMAISSAVREALSNVAEHAGTSEAWVTLRATTPEEGAGDHSRLRVVVCDRGAGFDPARVDRARLGLRRSIAERAADCGGRATIWSAPGQGTEVSLTWPALGTAEPAEDYHRGLLQPGAPW